MKGNSNNILLLALAAGAAAFAFMGMQRPDRIEQILEKAARTAYRNAEILAIRIGEKDLSGTYLVEVTFRGEDGEKYQIDLHITATGVIAYSDNYRRVS